MVVLNHLSLDGVMQGPGRADEDTRGGFARGGWAEPDNDEVMGRVVSERMANSGGWLFGRRTYEELLRHWNEVPDSPFGPALNQAPKYVASTTLTEPLPWPNSTLLRADVATAVATLKKQSDRDLGVMGSGELIRALLPHDLIDEWVLMVHPVVLGRGHRLFGDGAPFTTLRLADSVTTTTGVVIATYHPTRMGNEVDENANASHTIEETR